MELQAVKAPHIKENENVRTMFGDACLALVPLVAMSIYYYSMRALIICLVSVTTCFLADVFALAIQGKKVYGNFSGIITGLIIAVSMPASVPYYVVITAGLFAILVAKHPFGGLGNNIFNPACAGIVFVTICWRDHVTLYPRPTDITKLQVFGKVTAKLEPAITSSLNEGSMPGTQISELLFGNFRGPMGATCILVILGCALFLLYRKSISWFTPVSFAASLTVFSVVFSTFDFSGAGSFSEMMTKIPMIVLYEFCAGSAFFAMIFIATDPVTTPTFWQSKVMFGLGLGFLTVFFRRFGQHTEGVFAATLAMNSISGFLDKLILDYQMDNSIFKRFKERRHNYHQSDDYVALLATVEGDRHLKAEEREVKRQERLEKQTQKRLEAEEKRKQLQEERERKRAEEAERKRIEAEKEAERKRIEAEKAEKKRIEDEKKEAERKRIEAEKAEKKRIEDEKKEVERKRLEVEEAERKLREDEEKEVERENTKSEQQDEKAVNDTTDDSDGSKAVEKADEKTVDDKDLDKAKSDDKDDDKSDKKDDKSDKSDKPKKTTAKKPSKPKTDKKSDKDDKDKKSASKKATKPKAVKPKEEIAEEIKPKSQPVVEAKEDEQPVKPVQTADSPQNAVEEKPVEQDVSVKPIDTPVQVPQPVQAPVVEKKPEPVRTEPTAQSIPELEEDVLRLIEMFGSTTSSAAPPPITKNVPRSRSSAKSESPSSSHTPKAGEVRRRKTSTRGGGWSATETEERKKRRTSRSVSEEGHDGK